VIPAWRFACRRFAPLDRSMVELAQPAPRSATHDDTRSCHRIAEVRAVFNQIVQLA